MWILNFNNFLNESKGVAEASITFIPYLSKVIEKRFQYFFKSKENKVNYTENIRFNSLKEYITDIDLYYKFPVVGFDINYEFIKYNDYEFHKKFPNTSLKSPISLGGGAQSFGNKNWTEYSRMSDPQLGASDGIILYLMVEVHVDEDWFDPTNEIHSSLLDEGIKSTLYHEMNHFYEIYYLTKRKMPGKSIRDRGFLNTSVTLSRGDSTYGIPDSIVQYWDQNFIFYTYLCEDFELRSHVQEMDFYFREHPQQSIQDSRIYKYYDYMSKFDSDRFYDDMSSVINLNWDVDSDYVINNLKNRWVSNYKKSVKNFFKNSKPAISISKLESMDGYEFIKYWELIFHEKGDYVKRKIYKLSSNYPKK